MATEFSSIRFGYASAEQEGANEPSLLLDGYFNQEGLIEKVRRGSEFLFLGYKGSGKSAIGEHLRLLSNQEPNLFVTVVYLSNFPYDALKRLVPGDDSLESRLPTAWSWLILTVLCNSLSKDTSVIDGMSLEFHNVLQILKLSGLSSSNLHQLTLVTSKRSFEIDVPTAYQSEQFPLPQEKGLQIPLFVERMTDAMIRQRIAGEHLLIVDGLDDILTQRNVQYESLAALVFAVNRLNLAFQRVKSRVKVVLLCRTDLYERLPGANKNKIRQDSSVNLDWYHDPRRPELSGLVSLANLRAKLTDPAIGNVFAEYFPSQLRRQQTLTFLLDLTRHSPRDFVQILRHVQKFSVAGRVTQQQLLSGARSYSINYFLPEIKDELVGYVTPEDIDLMIDLFGQLRKRDFSFVELEGKAHQEPKFAQLDLPRIMSALFECSAIGNVQDKTRYYTFRYRNRYSTLNLGDRLILHKGMWKALNLA